MLATAILLLATQTKPPVEPVEATLDQLAFMVGHWEGSRGNAWCEEVWTAPKDGIMQGSFRLHQNGKLEFSESERLVQEGGKVKLKIKHFRTDFSGYETQTETTDFDVVAVGENTVTFYRPVDQTYLSYKREGKTTQAWLHKDSAKPKDDLVFKFKLIG